VGITSTTADASIRFTNDGTPATCTSGTVYSAPIEVSTNTTLSAIGCAAGKIDSAVASAAYVITPPAAPPVFNPAAGSYTSVQSVTLTSATAGASFRYTTDGSEPSCTTGQSGGNAIAIANSLTLKAVACAAGFSDSAVTSGGYDITLPPEQSVWRSFDFDNLAVSPQIFAAGSTSTNETGEALNISGRGKVESTQQVFHYVYTPISGDFVMTARLDGVDFAGFTSNQGRAGLLLTPDIAATGSALVYGSAIYNATPSFARSDRITASTANANSNIAVTGSGSRYLKLARTGNTYRASASLDGGATWVDGSVRTFAAAPFGEEQRDRPHCCARDHAVMFRCSRASRRTGCCIGPGGQSAPRVLRPRPRRRAPCRCCSWH
jgi:hypothetical protein